MFRKCLNSLNLFYYVCGEFTTKSQCTSLGSAIKQNTRLLSTIRTQQPGPLTEYQVDPYRMLEDDIKDIFTDIRNELRRNTKTLELQTVASYYFDGQGMALTPMLAILMAKAINYQIHNKNSGLLDSQRKIAMVSEMLHTASLVHDDVVDQPDMRRGKPSINVLWDNKKVTMAGNFILTVMIMLVARLQNDDVTYLIDQIIMDMVQGEFMQIDSKGLETEKLTHYLTTNYRKTASLIANILKAIAMLAGADEALIEVAYLYGCNVGHAFQLVDDLLDFVSSSDMMGKPAAIDLKLGLATAPVLFACEQFPELKPMIVRRFEEPGDVERAFELVYKSQGLEETQFLAHKYCIEAVKQANLLIDSPYQKGLKVVTDLVINRIK